MDRPHEHSNCLVLAWKGYATLHVLLIMTFRPEFEPPWIGRPYVTALTINRLGQREVSAMIDRVVGNKSLAESVREDIIERTDGIPLFVEEITKAVLEAESQRAAEHAIAVIPPPALEVPASLHASLMARLDQLGPAKEVAQIGAAIGREFSRALLAAVVRKPEEELNSALDRLLAAGLVFRQGVPPDTSYLFKHALVQDAAHGTLLREPRRALHARIAETLESQFAEIVERQPELLGASLHRGGANREGRAPVGQSGTVVARPFGSSGSRRLSGTGVGHYRAAATFCRPRQPRAHAPGAATLGAASVAGLGVAGSAGERDSHSSVGPTKGPTPESTGRAVGNVGQHDHARPHGRDPRLGSTSARRRKRGGNIDLQILGHRASLSSHFYLGELNEALEQRDKVLALYDPQRAARWRELTGNDVRTAVGVFSSQALWMLGYPDQAVQMSDQKDAHARRLGHAFDIGWALTWGTYVFDYRCEPDRLLARVHEADRIGREQSIPVLYKVIVPAGEGLAMLRKGQLPEAISLLQRGIEGWRATGGHLNLPYLKSALAEALSRQGDLETGLRLLDECLDQIERPGWHERVWLAEVLRLKGWVLMRQGRRTEAEAQLRASIECARRQQARSWELRSSTTLAELLIECGQRDAARQLLAPIYDWFTEGFDTHDLKAARALLEDIR